MITAKVAPTLSASSLKVFEDCARLYEYSFFAPRPWPAPANPDQEKAEAVMTNGQVLHQLVHLHARGHDPSVLASTRDDLERWFDRYLQTPYAAPTGRVFSEQALTLAWGGRKLVVKLDRVIHTGDRWVIIDWKTSKRAPDSQTLERDWQARLYPFALAEAGAALNGGAPIAPEAIEMVFCYLDVGVEHRMPYDAAKHAANAAALDAALAAIAAAEAGEMAATGVAKGRCQKPPCRFHSLCHMAPPPASEWRAEEDDAPVGGETLQLLAEFEFEDEAIVL